MLNLQVADGSAARASIQPRAESVARPSQRPLPVLLLRRGTVSERHLAVLHHDRRVELIETRELTPGTVALAQRVSGVLVAASDDPLDGLSYALTAGVTAPIVLGLLPHFRRDCRDLVDAGAAGCVVMPFRPPEADKLVKLLSAHAGHAHVDTTLRLLLDPISRVVRHRDKTVALSQREFAVLHCLSGRSGQPVAADELLRYVWGDRGAGRPARAILEVYIFQVRQKLACLGLQGAISTVRGFGYALVPVATPQA